MLGPITIERRGAPVAVGGPRQRSVLARLVLAERRMVTTERLVEDVWGDDAPPAAVNTLQSYVSLLRRALGDADLLRREGPGYVLDLEPTLVDATSFERLVGEGQALLERDPASALAALDAALALWRGPAYADMADQEWAVAEAVRLDELRLAALEVRFDALLALGRHAAAVPELERAVDEHPLRERFAAQLLLALYRSGRQADALRVFDRTRRHLLDELGLDPSPELTRLQTAILAHEPWLAAARPEAPAPAPVPEDRRPPAAPVPLPDALLRHEQRPFVGRAAALEVLRTAWQASLEGGCRLVLLSGEAGSGKTRLAARFAAGAAGDGAVVLWGRATTEAIVPYEPVVEALRTLLHALPVDDRHRLVDGRGALGLLLPDLPSLVPGAEIARPEVGTERYVLFETVVDLLHAESAASPLVLVIDDLQEADQLSLRLLEHLLRHERRPRVLVVATQRTLAVAADATLEAWLTGLHRDGLLTRIAVEGLDVEEVAALLDAPASAAAAIHHATGGNPFFVTELADHGGGATPEALPASVREVLGARLDRLDERATRLVAVAAVGGPVVALPVLAAATGLEGEDLLDAIDLAIAAGVLTEEGSSDCLTFPHALVQQAALERLSRSRRFAIHLAVAAALRDQPDRSRSDLARHLLAAGPLAPKEQVVEAAVGAGCDALAVLAYEEAARWADRALEAAGPGGPGRCEALLLGSDAHRALGDRDAARAAAAEAADEARRTRDPMLLARAAEAVAVARAGLGFDFGTEDPGLDTLLDEALEALPEEATETRLRLLGASVSNAAAEGDRTAVRSVGEEALRLAEASDHPLLVATVHLAWRMASWRKDLLEDRLTSVRAALAAAERAGSVPLQLNALLYGMNDLTEAGEVEEAEAWFARYQRTARAIRQPVYDAFGCFLQATERLLRGDYEAAAKLADEGLALGHQSHGANAEQAWAAQTFVRAWDRGELPSLLPVVSAAIDRPPGLPVWRLGHAACLVAVGRAEEARPALEAFVGRDGMAADDNSLWSTSGVLLVELARSLGDAERAAVLRSVLEPYAGRVVVSGLGRATLGPLARSVGVAAAVAGDLDAALRHLGDAERFSRRVGATPHLARALWERSVVLRRRGGPGDGEAAGAAEVEARGLAEGIGLVLGPLEAASHPV